jgi:hypothetical protein
MRLPLSLLKLVSFVLLAGSLHAGVGKAFLPHWASSDAESSHYHLSISNLTKENVTVEIALMNAAGNKLPGVYLRNGKSHQGGIATSVPSKFVIRANETRILHVAGIEGSGFGWIEWQQEGSASQTLIAHAWIRSLTETQHLPVNAGLPF